MSAAASAHKHWTFWCSCQQPSFRPADQLYHLAGTRVKTFTWSCSRERRSTRSNRWGWFPRAMTSLSQLTLMPATTKMPPTLPRDSVCQRRTFTRCTVRVPLPCSKSTPPCPSPAWSLCPLGSNTILCKTTPTLFCCAFPGPVAIYKSGLRVDHCQPRVLGRIQKMLSLRLVSSRKGRRRGDGCIGCPSQGNHIPRNGEINMCGEQWIIIL